MSPFDIAAAAFAIAYLLWYCYRPAGWSKSVTKTLSVSLLALGVPFVGAPPVLAVALGLCALGDFLLSRDNDKSFMAGVGAFAAGHLAYVWLFLTHPLSQPASIFQMSHAGPILLLAMLGVAMAAILWPRAGEMRGPVMGYIPVILSMGVAVLALPGQGALALARYAAALFILSDTVLSAELFVLPERHRVRRMTPFVVWSCYWLAQYAFFLAFLPLPAL